MDPDANLEEQLVLADILLKNRRCDVEERTENAQRLAELVVALDEWMRKGGFMPLKWARP